MDKLILKREDVDLAELVKSSIESWRAAGRLENHRLTIQAEAVWINADRARIEQIFSNLLDNAVKFTPAGGRIDVRVAAEDGMALLTLGDEGRGFTPNIAD